MRSLVRSALPSGIGIQLPRMQSSLPKPQPLVSTGTRGAVPLSWLPSWAMLTSLAPRSRDGGHCRPGARCLPRTVLTLRGCRQCVLNLHRWVAPRQRAQLPQVSVASGAAREAMRIGCRQRHAPLMLPAPDAQDHLHLPWSALHRRLGTPLWPRAQGFQDLLPRGTGRHKRLVPARSQAALTWCALPTDDVPCLSSPSPSTLRGCGQWVCGPVRPTVRPVGQHDLLPAPHSAPPAPAAWDTRGRAGMASRGRGVAHGQRRGACRPD